jgi:hypothetical protein
MCRNEENGSWPRSSMSARSRALPTMVLVAGQDTHQSFGPEPTSVRVLNSGTAVGAMGGLHEPSVVGELLHTFQSDPSSLLGCLVQRHLSALEALLPQ